MDCGEQGGKNTCLIGGVSLKKNGTINKGETVEEKGAGRSEQTYTNPHSAPALGLFILQIELSTSPL